MEPDWILEQSKVSVVGQWLTLILAKAKLILFKFKSNPALQVSTTRYYLPDPRRSEGLAGGKMGDLGPLPVSSLSPAARLIRPATTIARPSGKHAQVGGFQ